MTNFKVKIFADGANKEDMLKSNENPLIKGFTTNPTLMKKAGITNYVSFAKDILKVIKDKPISFEVFADDFDNMERQALEISSWGSNVNIKIPVSNTKGQYSYKLIQKLANQGVKLNITALMTIEQVRETTYALMGTSSSYISVFAGRIADTGRDPVPQMIQALNIMKHDPNLQLIWASPREVLNIYQADRIGCHVITVTNSILNKLAISGKDLTEFSLDTVKMFYNDAKNVGYTI